MTTTVARITSPLDRLSFTAPDRFVLDADFVARYAGRQPAWGGNGLGYLVYVRSYARPLADGSREEFWQTLQRVVEGVYTIQAWHCRSNGLDFDREAAQREAQEMFVRMWEFKLLPPGRGLWMMGTQYVEENGSASLLNCAFRSTANIGEDFAAPFAFLADMSMLGVGVGFDTRGAGSITIQRPVVGSDTYQVADSREGWVALMSRVLNSYVGRDTMPARIDYSAIRPAGTPLKRFGGTAAGAQPLIDLIERFIRVLDARIGKPIDSTAIVDLMNVIGVCVVAGNVRRSSEIALGSASDLAFLELKNPDLFPNELNSHRWASNNSVIVHDGEEVDYDRLATMIAKNGEPGILWLDRARAFGRLADPADWKDIKAAGVNPCSEQVLEDGELCCLVETFPSRHETLEDYLDTLLIAHRYAKTVTLLPLHDPLSDEIQQRNRRMGISMSGIVQAIEKIGMSSFVDWIEAGFATVKSADRTLSAAWGINESIRLTTVKPSGSVSLLPYVTPGVHFEHSPYYFRTVRVAKTSSLIKRLERAGYRIENDVYDPSSKVVYFPIAAELFKRSKTDVSIREQFELAALLQERWSENAVSVTITFKREEVPQIPGLLREFAPRLKAVSLLPLDDHNYEQAPYQAIDRDVYEDAMAALRPLDLSGATSHEVTDAFCDGDRCEVPMTAADDHEAVTSVSSMIFVPQAA